MFRWIIGSRLKFRFLVFESIFTFRSEVIRQLRRISMIARPISKKYMEHPILFSFSELYTLTNTPRRSLEKQVGLMILRKHGLLRIT